jgi:hypothetical protein
MRATIVRQYYPKQTLGTLTVYDEDTGKELFQCRSLELPWKNNQRNVSCIPEGVYVVDVHNSPTFGKCYWIKDVKDRSEVLIHRGNYAGSLNPKTGKPDIRGCVLVGKTFVDLNGDGIADITESQKTLDKLLLAAPDGFVLTVTQ